MHPGNGREIQNSMKPMEYRTQSFYFINFIAHMKLQNLLLMKEDHEVETKLQ